MAIISLTTDFGQFDGYVGVMKGVILGIAPDAQLVDLSHEIAPQDVRQATHVLARAMPFFPQGAIHVVVVDPGVGAARRPILVTTASAVFVGPDNGVLTPALTDATAKTWQLDRPEFWLPEVSATFHGRDVFAPVAGHLARGVRPELMASRVSDAVRLALPRPQRLPDGSIQGEVVHADRFGNLITNIPGEWLTGESHRGHWQCYVARSVEPVLGPLSTYSDGASGAPLALVSSSGMLEIAVRDGSAQRMFGAGPGAPVLVRPGLESYQ
jgi:S-adenosylmethionine hydrolase